MKIIVVGCGKVGRTIIERVRKEGHTITVIDTDKAKIEEAIEKFDVVGVVGNGASLEILEEAGVKNTNLVVAITSSDEMNILSCMAAKKAGADSTIARVRNPEYIRQTKLMQEELGLTLTVNPEQETSEEIMNMINLPSIVKLEHFAKGKVSLIEIIVEEKSMLAGETLISMAKKIKTKVLVCAVQRGTEVYIPTGNFVIEAGDHLHITADASSLADFLQEVKLNKSPLKNIMIIGGGKIGYYLANELSKKKYKVKLLESNTERANELAELLPKVTVLNCDGSDHEVLIEEGIRTTDACISLTNIDEENIIISMYANKQKVPKVITKLKRSTFANMFDDLGIASVVMPKEIIANKIVSYIRAVTNKRGSNVMTLYKLVNNKVEALEFFAKKKSRHFGKPLRDLHVKENCLIACIIREGQVIIPNGNDCIMLNDSVIVVTKHENFDDLKDIFE